MWISIAIQEADTISKTKFRSLNIQKIHKYDKLNKTIVLPVAGKSIACGKNGKNNKNTLR